MAMRIRKYEGTAMTEVLRKVKQELGPEAVILNVSSPAAPSGAVEITAALDENHDERTVLPRSGRREGPLADDTHTLVQEIQEIKELIHSYTEYHQYARLPKELHSLVAALRDNGVEAFIVDELVEWLLIELKGDELSDRGLIRRKTQEILQRAVTTSGGIQLREDRPTVVCLVGPAGSGKTTTVAKIAAEFAFSRKIAVSVVTADTKRIAAVYQLRCYSEALGLPFRTVYSPQQMRDAVRSDSAQLIVVDTTGVNPLNKEELDELAAFLSPISPDEVYLLLSVTTRFKSSVETINAFKSLPVTGLLFTKIDEMSTRGSILSIATKTDTAVCYLTNGRSVPGNIELADKEKLAEWALRRYV